MKINYKVTSRDSEYLNLLSKILENFSLLLIPVYICLLAIIILYWKIILATLIVVVVIKQFIPR